MDSDEESEAPRTVVQPVESEDEESEKEEEEESEEDSDEDSEDFDMENYYTKEDIDRLFGDFSNK